MNRNFAEQLLERWGPLVDCQVKTSDGYYVPYDRYRIMEQKELKRK